MCKDYEGFEEWCEDVNIDLQQEMENAFAMLDSYGNDFEFPYDYYYGNEF